MSENHRSSEPVTTFAFEAADSTDSCSTGIPHRRDGRKAKQLCRQVAETLDLVLSGDCRDDLIQSLHVVSVEPAPNSSRLLVVVTSDLPAEQYDWHRIMDRLRQQAGRLRAEVAASINRKKVPLLAFHLLGPS